MTKKELMIALVGLDDDAPVRIQTKDGIIHEITGYFDKITGDYCGSNRITLIVDGVKL